MSELLCGVLLFAQLDDVVQLWSVFPSQVAPLALLGEPPYKTLACQLKLVAILSAVVAIIS